MGYQARFSGRRSIAPSLHGGPGRGGQQIEGPEVGGGARAGVGPKARQVADAVGEEDRGVALEIELDKGIPLGSGMGGSAASGLAVR